MIKNFKCKRCGSCCNPPRLYAEDIGSIRKSGHKNFIYTDNLGHTYMKDKEDGKCIFLSKKGKIFECSIYPQRPRICREYPSRLINGSCKPEELAFDRFLRK